MSMRRWFQLFAFNFIQLLLSALVIMSVVVERLKLIGWRDLLSYQFLRVPLYTWLIAFMIVTSSIVASVILYFIERDFGYLRAKINWLLLNKYGHHIFKKSQPTSYSRHTDALNTEIELLRQKMMEMSKDLQELSAAPTFIGEDTKDEIIQTERLRIARELHDSVSQELFAATMLMSTMNTMVSEEEYPALKQQIVQIEDIINSAQTEMRALLLHLRPVELKNRSLSEGIENILTELNGKVAVDVHWHLDSSIELESGIEDHLFRVTQEAIANTLRHANAKRLEVFLTQASDQVQLKIIDDGNGFDVTSVRQSGNYGLTNMKERVSNLGGTLKINSNDQGTVITINIPITT